VNLATFLSAWFQNAKKIFTQDFAECLENNRAADCKLSAANLLFRSLRATGNAVEIRNPVQRVTSPGPDFDVDQYGRQFAQADCTGLAA